MLDDVAAVCFRLLHPSGLRSLALMLFPGCGEASLSSWSSRSAVVGVLVIVAASSTTTTFLCWTAAGAPASPTARVSLVLEDCSSRAITCSNFISLVICEFVFVIVLYKVSARCYHKNIRMTCSQKNVIFFRTSFSTSAAGPAGAASALLFGVPFSGADAASRGSGSSVVIFLDQRRLCRGLYISFTLSESDANEIYASKGVAHDEKRCLERAHLLLLVLPPRVALVRVRLILQITFDIFRYYSAFESPTKIDGAIFIRLTSLSAQHEFISLLAFYFFHSLRMKANSTTTTTTTTTICLHNVCKK